MLELYKSLFDYKIIFTSSYVAKHINRKATDSDKTNRSAHYRAKSKVLDYAKNNIFNYFFTCTIDNNKFDIQNHFLLKKTLLKHFNNFKNQHDSSFKYLLVAEKGSKNNRLHFHGLIYLSNTRLLKHIGRGIYRDEWFFNVFGANNWQKIKDYNLSCANYICKYITKDEEKSYKYNYFASHGLKKSILIAKLNPQNEKDNEYQRQLDFLFGYLSNHGLVKDYDFCSVASLNKEQYNEILLNCMYNPDFQRGFKQLCFSDLKGGAFIA